MARSTLDRIRDHLGNLATKRRRDRIRWAVCYPVATVAPLVFVAAFEPVVGLPPLVLVTLLSGFYLGVFGEDRRAEFVEYSLPSRTQDGGLPRVDVPESGFSGRNVVDFATGVTLMGVAGVFGLLKLVYGY